MAGRREEGKLLFAAVATRNVRMRGSVLKKTQRLPFGMLAKR